MRVNTYQYQRFLTHGRLRSAIKIAESEFHTAHKMRFSDSMAPGHTVLRLGRLKPQHARCLSDRRAPGPITEPVNDLNNLPIYRIERIECFAQSAGKIYLLGCSAKRRPERIAPPPLPPSTPNGASRL